MSDRPIDERSEGFPSRTSWIPALLLFGGVIGAVCIFLWNRVDRRSLREQWDATPSAMDEQEKLELLATPVTFERRVYGDPDPDQPLPLLGAHVIGEYVTRVVDRDMIPELAQRPGRKIVITNEEFLQVFEAYANQRHPVFITSDSILNAFHIVFEDSFLGLECALAAQLPKLIVEMRESLSAVRADEDEVMRSAVRRAQIVLAVANRLIDPESTLVNDPEIARIVAEEVERVERSRGRTMPKWLGTPTSRFLAIDYSRFRPVGFYTRSDRLERYFRCVQWLQAIPFYADRDDELLSMLLISRAAEKTGWPEFGKTYYEFLGEPDDWDISIAAGVVDTTTSIGIAQLAAVRDRLTKRLESEPVPGRINDLVHFRTGNDELNFRILSGYRMPESVLFRKTTNDEPGQVPSGLELCAALGSEFAGQNLARRTELLPVIEQNRGLFDGKSIYSEYLACLRTLVAELPATAPDFMNTDAWHAKSCQTVLASWAQARHAVTLQAKQIMSALNGGGSVASGFVEPNPEFYRRLRQLIKRIQESLHRAEALHLNLGQLELELRESIRIIKFLQSPERSRSLTEGARRLRGSLFMHLYAQGVYSLADDDLQLALVRFVHLLDAVERGELPEDPDAQHFLWSLQNPIESRWQQLNELCSRLEELATKQLQGDALDDVDNKFIEEYGDTLAALLLYEDLAAMSPRDDAVRAVTVLTAAQKLHWHAAVGRPRAIYVLYPYQGTEVLCRGAVLPYYEFTHSSPLTDDEWKALLDSPERPKQPDWLNVLQAR
jgi:hypothetical protein